MILREVDLQPERNAVAKHSYIGGDAAAKGEAIRIPVELFHFIRLLTLLLDLLRASHASHVLDHHSIDGECDRREHGHEDRCPRAESSDDWLQFSELADDNRNLGRADNWRKRNHNCARNDKYHAHVVVALKLLMKEPPVREGGIQWSKRPDHRDDARVHVRQVGEPHGHERHDLDEQVAEAEADEAKHAQTIALGGSIVLGQDCQIVVHFESARALITAAVSETSHNLVNDTDENRARREVEDALWAFVVRDLADACVADGEKNRGGERPTNPGIRRFFFLNLYVTHF